MDVRHLLLSHIHLDHAGAAGVLVRQNPWLQVHVSEIGAPHLVDPSKLDASARRLYGSAFDELWGELAPVPASNVHVVGDHILGFDCFPTPGHAWHHVSYLEADGTLYAGDAAGVRLTGGQFVMPPCPPPELDLEAWEETIAEIERHAPSRLALIHFGVVDDVQEHLSSLRDTLRRWGKRVEDGMDEDTFIAAARLRRLADRPGARGRVRARRPVLAPLPRHRAVLAQATRDGHRNLGGSVRFEVGERDELERRRVRRLQHDRWRDTGLKRLLPPRRDDAPAVARFQPREQPLRLRRHEVVAR